MVDMDMISLSTFYRPLDHAHLALQNLIPHHDACRIPHPRRRLDIHLPRSFARSTPPDVRQHFYYRSRRYHRVQIRPRTIRSILLLHPSQRQVYHHRLPPHFGRVYHPSRRIIHLDAPESQPSIRPARIDRDLPNPRSTIMARPEIQIRRDETPSDR